MVVKKEDKIRWFWLVSNELHEHKVLHELKKQHSQWHSNYPECTSVQSWNREEQTYFEMSVSDSETGMRTIPILTSKTLTMRGRGCCDLASGGLRDWFHSLGWFSSCSAGFCAFYEVNRPWADSVVVGQNAVYYSLVWCFHTWIRTSLRLFGGNTKLH